MAEASESVVTAMESDDVFLSHAKSIIRIEEKSSQRLLDLYKGVRVELRERLDLLASDKFEAQQVRGVLTQVEQGILLLQDKINEEITLASFEAAGNATRDIVTEIQSFENEFTGAVIEIPIDQAMVAESTRALKLIQYESSIQTYGRDLIDRINRLLIDATIQQKPYFQIVRELAGRGGMLDMESWRIQRLVRTELHSIYDLTRLEALRAIQAEQIDDLMKISLDPLDNRTALDSIAVKGQIKDIHEPFRFRGVVVDPRNGKETFIDVKPFMNHPNRPNDRGVTAPFRKSWETSVK